MATWSEATVYMGIHWNQIIEYFDQIGITYDYVYNASATFIL